MVVEHPGQAAIDALRNDATELARARALDPAGVDVILGPPGREPTRRSKHRLDSPDALGIAYESMRSALAGSGETKSAGRYYTPTELVEPTVERTLAPLDVRRSDFAVCDPAAGGGAFLLSVMRTVTRRLMADDHATTERAARTMALERTFGVDLDPHAARVARLAIWFEAADPALDPRRTADQVRVADARTMDWLTAFPRVFDRGPEAGFDAVVGNPPWDIDKPDSKAFFAAVDPEYPSYTKQRALEQQRELLARDPALASRWHATLSRHKQFGAWLRSDRSTYSRQGRGDGNRYKLFTELAWNLTRSGGRIGLIVPSGIYTDAGSKQLREMLLHESSWEWLFGFENRARVFAIDNRFKFAVLIAQKGGVTRSIRTAFLRTDVADWLDPTGVVEIRRDRIEAMSPRSLAIPEIRDPRDMRILERIADSTSPLGDALDAGDIEYRRELDLTLDSHRFSPREDWEAQGYRPSSDSRWLKCRHIEAQLPPSVELASDSSWIRLRGENAGWVHTDDVEDVALPLYEGRMLGSFDLSERGWVEGRGRRAVWREIPFDGHPKPVEPQYLLPASELAVVDPDHERPKLGFMAIASATNRRSMIAAAILGAPCGNSVPTLRSADAADDLLLLVVLNSFAFDWALRLRMGGINLNRFVLAESPMLRETHRVELLGRGVAAIAAALCWTSPAHARAWRAAGLRRSRPALDDESRAQRRAVLDAVVACALGLSIDDFEWILRDTQHSTARLRDRTFVRTLDPKGFWRVDSAAPPELRAPARALRTFRDLQTSIDRSPSRRAAIVALCAQFPEARAQLDANPPLSEANPIEPRRHDA